MTLSEYIKIFIDPQFSIGEKLPFPVSKHFFKKGTIITQIGEIEKFAYFLNDGIAEMSMIHDDNEVIVDFYFDDDFFSSYESLLLDNVSLVQITALTDISVEKVLKLNLQNSYQTSLLANKIGRHATEKLYLKKIRRERNLLTMTAEQYYLDLINNRGKLINKIPVNKIAKYLAIKPESLSRIRKHSFPNMRL